MIGICCCYYCVGLHDPSRSPESGEAGKNGVELIDRWVVAGSCIFAWQIELTSVEPASQSEVAPRDIGLAAWRVRTGHLEMARTWFLGPGDATTANSVTAINLLSAPAPQVESIQRSHCHPPNEPSRCRAAEYRSAVTSAIVNWWGSAFLPPPPSWSTSASYRYGTVPSRFSHGPRVDTATMPSDVEEVPEAKEWEDNNASLADRWLGGSRPWKVLKSALTLGLLRSLLLYPSRPSGTGAGANGQPEKKLRPTAYLDGLRGFAAFIVYWHHHELWARRKEESEFLEYGFGHGGQHYFASLPGIRTFFGGGHFAVSTFFVISGYVLSTKPMSLIHTGDQAKLADNLGSALFRRWLRLYIPLICVTFVYMTSWHLFGFWIDGTKPKPTYGQELWSWYAELKNFSFVFNSGGEPWFTYGFHLWSIPVEFRGSIVVYTALQALARCTRNARLWLEAGLVFYFLYIADGWYCALFVSGILLCDLDLLAAKDDLPAFFERLQPHRTVLFYVALAISFYLGGVPAPSSNIKDLRETGGWYFLSFLKPQAVFDYKWFYLFWASTLLVASIPRIPWLRRFFETRFCQFLGRVSFALYLVHGPVLWTLGDRMYALAGWENDARKENIMGWLGKFPLPQIGPKGLEVAFLVPHLILLPATFYCAEVVTRMFDEPSVRFPQWFYKKTLGRPAGLPG